MARIWQTSTFNDKLTTVTRKLLNNMMLVLARANENLSKININVSNILWNKTHKEVTSVTANYTISTEDRVIECNGTFTVTLHKPVFEDVKTIVNIGSGEITIGGETVNGVSNMVLSPNSAVDIYANNSEWRIG